MSARSIADRDQVRERVFALRVLGTSYRGIAQRTGISAMTALDMCRSEIADSGPYAARLRALEVGLVDQQLAMLHERRAELVGAITQGGTEQ